MSEVYRVVVTREGENWLADVPSVEGAHTYARTLYRLDHEVREVIALGLDLPEGAETSLDLDWEIHTGNEALDEQAAKLRAKRKIILGAERQLVADTAVVVGKLRAEGDFSVRDTAFLTGVSHQRISQMA